MSRGVAWSNLDTQPVRKLLGAWRAGGGGGPPRIVKLVFVQIEILGKTSGAAGAEEFFLGTRHGVKLFIPPVCGNSECAAHIWDFKSSA